MSWSSLSATKRINTVKCIMSRTAEGPFKLNYFFYFIKPSDSNCPLVVSFQSKTTTLEKSMIYFNERIMVPIIPDWLILSQKDKADKKSWPKIWFLNVYLSILGMAWNFQTRCMSEDLRVRLLETIETIREVSR